MAKMIDSAPDRIYTHTPAGEGAQWFLHRHGVEYIKAHTFALAAELRRQGFIVSRITLVDGTVEPPPDTPSSP